MSNTDKVLIVGAVVAVGVALAVAWPAIRIAMLRRSSGIIEENGYLYDPRTQTYYNASSGAVVYRV